MQSKPKSPVFLMTWLHEPEILHHSRPLAHERGFHGQPRVSFWKDRFFFFGDIGQRLSRRFRARRLLRGNFGVVDRKEQTLCLEIGQEDTVWAADDMATIGSRCEPHLVVSHL